MANGLLDFLNTPQGIGLLSGIATYAANAQRGRPVNSIGRGLAGGLAGYGLAQDQIRQAEQDKINNELRQFQIQQARDAIARQKAISEKVAGALKPGTPAEAPMQLMGDMPFGMGGQMPEVKPATPPTFFGKPIDPAMAEMLPLMEPEKALQYAMPKERKVKDWQKVTVDGRVLYAPYFEDGSVGQPVPYDVAEKLNFQDTGGSVVGLNPFTGQTVGGAINKTMSPDAKASNALGWANNKLGWYNATKPEYIAEAGGFVSRQPNGAPGSVVKVPGLAPKMTEMQGKANLFQSRAAKADKVINDLQGKYSPLAINVKQGSGKVWGVGGSLEGIGNYLLSDEAQRVEQAQRDFVNAILRQESGAVITPEEFDNAQKQYFPQPGDSPAVIAQKRKNRDTAIKGLQAMVGRPSENNQPDPLGLR